MTPQEMVDSFGLNYASEINLSVPGWESSEILSFLNKSQEKLVRELYLSTGDRWLRELVKVVNMTTIIAYGPGIGITNAKIVDLSENGVTDFLYYLNSRTKLSRTNPTLVSEWVDNRVIEQSNAGRFATNSMNVVWFKEPAVFWEYTDKLIVLYDWYTSAINAVSLKYIKQFADIALTPVQASELNADLHQKIVDGAVLLALETLQSTRVQTQPIVNR